IFMAIGGTLRSYRQGVETPPDMRPPMKPGWKLRWKLELKLYRLRKFLWFQASGAMQSRKRSNVNHVQRRVSISVWAQMAQVGRRGSMLPFDNLARDKTTSDTVLPHIRCGKWAAAS
ncbi:MAG: hypothetical protein Q9204_007778, partial [Flavoplaca sp. TL-2023a]